MMESPDTVQTGTPPSTNSGPNSHPGLHKSDSTASVASRSSHVSMPVTGSHPLGTLQVHRPEDYSPSLSRKVLMKPLPPSPGEREDGPRGGDVVIVLDLPGKFTVGIDGVAFGAKTFLGVRGIPDGAHFLWTSATESSSMRSGVWFLSHPAKRKERIHVIQWDGFNEVLNEPAHTEARIQRANIATTLPKLTPYGSLTAPQGEESKKGTSDTILEDADEWAKLTCCITESVLARVTGNPNGPWPFHTTDRVKGSTILPAEMELEKHVSVVAVSELNFHFSQTTKTYDVASIGSARTEAAVDATKCVDRAVQNEDLSSTGTTEEDLIGELQLAFLVGMHLGNESCVHQWWHTAVTIFLRAHNLPFDRASLARLFIETLTAQLSYNSTKLDGSIFDFGPDYTQNLRLALIIYKRRLTELLLALNSHATEEQVAVGKAFDKLETLVWKFGWDLKGDYLRKGKVTLEDGEEVELEMDELEAEDERGEYAPAVVDLDGEGRQTDLVSWE